MHPNNFNHLATDKSIHFVDLMQLKKIYILHTNNLDLDYKKKLNRLKVRFRINVAIDVNKYMLYFGL